MASVWTLCSYSSKDMIKSIYKQFRGTNIQKKSTNRNETMLDTKKIIKSQKTPRNAFRKGS
jgi:hypothetical protein